MDDRCMTPPRVAAQGIGCRRRNVGATDLILDYFHAVRIGLPAVAGQLGAAYAIPVFYVPALMISHVAAFYLLTRHQPKAVWTLGREATAS